jgi:hypothetical protein
MGCGCASNSGNTIPGIHSRPRKSRKRSMRSPLRHNHSNNNMANNMDGGGGIWDKIKGKMPKFKSPKTEPNHYATLKFKKTPGSLPPPRTNKSHYATLTHVRSEQNAAIDANAAKRAASSDNNNADGPLPPLPPPRRTPQTNSPEQRPANKTVVYNNTDNNAPPPVRSAELEPVYAMVNMKKKASNRRAEQSRARNATANQRNRVAEKIASIKNASAKLVTTSNGTQIKTKTPSSVLMRHMTAHNLYSKTPPEIKAILKAKSIANSEASRLATQLHEIHAHIQHPDTPYENKIQMIAALTHNSKQPRDTYTDAQRNDDYDKAITQLKEHAAISNS